MLPLARLLFVWSHIRLIYPPQNLLPMIRRTRCRLLRSGTSLPEAKFSVGSITAYAVSVWTTNTTT